MYPFEPAVFISKVLWLVEMKQTTIELSQHCTWFNQKMTLLHREVCTPDVLELLTWAMVDSAWNILIAELLWTCAYSCRSIHKGLTVPARDLESTKGKFWRRLFLVRNANKAISHRVRRFPARFSLQQRKAESHAIQLRFQWQRIALVQRLRG